LHYGDCSLRECFGTGNAAMVSPGRQIRYRNRDIELPRSGVRPDTRGWLSIFC